MNVKLSFALILLSLLSCNDSRIDELEDTSRGEELTFSTNISTTKAAILDNAKLMDFGVYAYYSENRNFDINNSLPDFMYNTKVYKQEGDTKWKYDPIKYWPADESNKISFFAYAPYVSTDNDNGIVLSSEFKKGIPSLSYTVPVDVTKQRDLLLAHPLYNLTKGGVSFSFEHVLSCIKFEVVGRAHKVRSIIINGVSTEGDLDFEYPFVWKNLNSPQNVDFSAGLNYDSGKSYVLINTIYPENVLKNDGYLMMLPQTLADNAKIEIIHDNYLYAEIPLKNSNITAWEAGKSYIYRITINH